MKELSLEQKAKRYDEVVNEIKKLRDILLKEGVINENGIIYDNFNRIFPELKESKDDEKIKKEIIALIEWSKSYAASGITTDESNEMIAWLEKIRNQNLAKKYGITGIGSKHAEGKLGEMIKKKIETEKQDKQKFGQLEECLDCQFNYAGTCGGSCPLTRGERKPTDNTNNVEPKFHEGEWITDGNITIQIEAIKNDCYLYCGDCALYSTKTADKVYHLWTINDAKPGDIIYAESKFNTFDFIGIFYTSLENGNFWCYCDVSSDSDIYSDYLECWEFDSDKGFVALDRYNFYPATKKQRHLLYQKMKEAGYEWDNEKKELKDL